MAESRSNQTTTWGLREDKGCVVGVGLALAHLIRMFGRPSIAAEINRAFAYDLATYRRAGLEEYDLQELRKAIR